MQVNLKRNYEYECDTELNPLKVKKLVGFWESPKEIALIESKTDEIVSRYKVRILINKFENYKRRKRTDKHKRRVSNILIMYSYMAVIALFLSYACQ
jgi:hypothetical protein